jgi:hypothetical protein
VRTLTISGVLESLVATAIWAALVFLAFRTRKHFRDELAKNRERFDWLRQIMSGDVDYSTKQDVYFFITLFLNRLQRKLADLKKGRIGTLILMSATVYWGYKEPGGNEMVIALLAYLILLAFESYQIWQGEIRVKELEDALFASLFLDPHQNIKSS